MPTAFCADTGAEGTTSAGHYFSLPLPSGSGILRVPARKERSLAYDSRRVCRVKMIPNDRMTVLWHRLRLKLMSGGLLAWVLFITLMYQDVKRGQRSGPARAEELREIGALQVT